MAGVHGGRRHLWKAEPVAVRELEGKEGRGREPCHYTVHAASSALCSLCAQIDKWTARSEGRDRERERDGRTDGRTDEESEKPAASTHTLRT